MAPHARSRWWSSVALAGVIALGLLSRRYPLPGVFAEHTGDALYVVAAFVAFAIWRPRASSWLLAFLAFAFAALIECSQLLNWSWLKDLRANRYAALVLGQGFQWADFLAYAVGALVAGILDRIACSARSRRR